MMDKKDDRKEKARKCKLETRIRKLKEVNRWKSKQGCEMAMFIKALKKGSGIRQRRRTAGKHKQNGETWAVNKLTQTDSLQV